MVMKKIFPNIMIVVLYTYVYNYLTLSSIDRAYLFIVDLDYIYFINLLSPKKVAIISYFFSQNFFNSLFSLIWEIGVEIFRLDRSYTKLRSIILNF